MDFFVKIFNAEPVTDHQEKAIRKHFRDLKECHPELFKRISDLDNVTLKWNPQMKKTLAAFMWYKPKSIQLSSVFKYPTPESDKERVMTGQVMPFICHELHHRYQYKLYNIFYILGSTWILRNFLERSADQIESRIKDIIKIQEQEGKLTYDE